MIERAITIKDAGWKQMLLSLTMYEVVIDVFLQACHAKAFLATGHLRHRGGGYRINTNRSQTLTGHPLMRKERQWRYSPPSIQSTPRCRRE